MGATNIVSGNPANPGASNPPGFGGSGPAHTSGFVPDPGATAGTTRYLREDGTWSAPPGGSGGGISDAPNDGGIYARQSQAWLAIQSAFVGASKVGVANGVASLDGTGKVPVAQLPASVVGGLNYQGTWNATTNTPTLVSGTGTKGFYYKVSVAGTTTIDGNSSWNIGDVIAFDGTTWDKFDGTSTEVVSVNGQIGAVSVTPANINAVPTSAVGAASGVASLDSGAHIPIAQIPPGAVNPGVMVASGTGHAAGLAPDPGATAGTTHYLREDGTWSVPPSATGAVMGASGSSHAAGAAPDPGATAGQTRYLREDATWQVPPSSATATKTLRNIATRCRSPGALVTANLFAFGRTLHINRGGSQQQLQLVYSNWGASYTGEQTNTAPLIISAAIEYPLGVYTQATWNGAATGSIAAGANGVSDVINVGIPDGATFWVRTYQSCTGGTWSSITACLDRTTSVVGTAGGRATIETYVGSASATTAYDASFVAGAGTAVNGFGPAGTSSNGYFPSAILGMSSVPSVLVVGDSRNSGLNDSAFTNIGLSGVGEICRSLDSTRPYCNMGYPTDQGATFVTTQGTTGYRKSLAPYYTHLHSQYGINDLIFGQTLAQLQATQAAIQGIFPGKVYSLSTLPPVTTSTDSWATATNQTVTTQGTVSTARPSYNTWVLTKPLSVQNAFDVASVVEDPNNPGKWKSVGAGSTWTNAAGTVIALTQAFTGDGTHENSGYGYGAVQQSGAVNGALIL